MIEQIANTNPLVDAIIKKFMLGNQYWKEGYEDMGFAIEHDALLKACELPEEDKKKVFEILTPLIR